MYRKIIIPENTKQVRTNRKKIKDEMDFGVNSTFSYLIGFISVAFIYLIWSLNTGATQGYDIRELEKQKQELLLKKETIEVKIANLEKLDAIQESKSKQEMQKVEDPDFIVIKNDIQYVFNNK